MSSARGKSSGDAAPRSRTSVSRRSKSPDMAAGQQPGLRRLVQKRFLDDVFEAASGKSQQEQCEQCRCLPVARIPHSPLEEDVMIF
jgi:hypothetical protein